MRTCLLMYVVTRMSRYLLQLYKLGRWITWTSPSQQNMHFRSLKPLTDRNCPTSISIIFTRDCVASVRWGRQRSSDNRESVLLLHHVIIPSHRRPANGFCRIAASFAFHFMTQGPLLLFTTTRRPSHSVCTPLRSAPQLKRARTRQLVKAHPMTFSCGKKGQISMKIINGVLGICVAQHNGSAACTWQLLRPDAAV